MVVQWFIALVAAPICLLLVAEMGLRAAGHGHSTRYLVKRTFDDGRVCYLPNRDFFQQFSTIPIDAIVDWDVMDYVLDASKPDNTVRIFVFGESAAYGAPCAWYGFSRYLEVMLRASFPGVRFEVCNTACSGMNSAVNKVIVAACAQRQPDMFIFYMGNNEGFGPYGHTTAFAHNRILRAVQFVLPIDVIQAHIWIGNLRLVQWPFLTARNQQLVAEDSSFLWRVPPVNGEQAYRHFERSLEEMCACAKQNGIPVLLCTLARNVAALGNAALNAESAPLRYPVNQPILRVAEAAHPGDKPRGSLRLVDVEEAFLQHAAPGTVPGYDLFTDVVHFTFDGNYLLASTLFSEVVELLPENLREKGASSVGSFAAPLSKLECEHRLGLSTAMKLHFMEQTAGSPLIEDAEREHHKAQIKQLREEVREDVNRAILGGFRNAIEQNPDDYRLRVQFLGWALDTHQNPVPLEEARRLAADFPYRRPSHRLLGVALQYAGEGSEGMQELRTALALYPDDRKTMDILNSYESK